MLLLDTGPTEGYLNKAEFYLSTFRVRIRGPQYELGGVRDVRVESGCVTCVDT